MRIYVKQSQDALWNHQANELPSGRTMNVQIVQYSNVRYDHPFLCPRGETKGWLRDEKAFGKSKKYIHIYIF